MSLMCACCKAVGLYIVNLTMAFRDDPNNSKSGNVYVKNNMCHPKICISGLSFSTYLQLAK